MYSEMSEYISDDGISSSSLDKIYDWTIVVERWNTLRLDVSGELVDVEFEVPFLEVASDGFLLVLNGNGGVELVPLATLRQPNILHKHYTIPSKEKR